MRCTKCEFENPAGMKFCGQCTSPLAQICPKCSFENPPGFKFCGQCTAPLQADTGTAKAKSIQQKPAAAVRVVTEEASPTLEGERKTVTALFADIKGSTELEQDLDPEEARAIVDPALKLMIDAVHRYDGYIVQSTGDGIFGLFGAPVAHEDHPQRALYAALRMQDELKRYSARLRETGNLPLEARVGVNTGEVVVRSITTGEGHTEYTPIGHTANLASRMQALAPTGSIAISEQTRKFVEGYFELKPLGPTRVKGVTEPVNVYEVTGLGPLRTRLQRSAGRGLSKFVGRDREMGATEAAAERAKAGHGQIVAAMAEAGTGKSRLLFEFKAKNQSGWMVLETFSVSHGKASAYMPVIDLLHGYFGIEGEDDARKRREKVGGKVLMLDRALEDTLPYLFALLGIVEGDDPLAQMDGQVKKRRSLDAIKRIILRESLNQPLMVIFEDLHWIDDETQALLNILADSIPNSKILMLVNYRPEYSHQWNSKTYYTQLRLDPLGKENADEMLTAMVGDSVEIRPLKLLIIERTQGNPFFMEETVQVLLDEGALVRDGAIARLTKPLGELKIPPTVQAILAARIDRLPTNEKDLLQTLAVIGKEFPLALVRAVVATDLTPISFPRGKENDISRGGYSVDELDRMLGDLQLAEFIYEQPAVGDVEYTFKHALTQEVGYNSILNDRRKQLHERSGAATEELYGDRLDDHLTALAHHFSRNQNTIKAIRYLRLAGTQAVRRSANSEAAVLLRSSLDLLKALPDSTERARDELDLLVMLGPVMLTLAGYASPEPEEVYVRARDLCAQLGDNTRLFAALWGLWICRVSRAELDQARQLAGELASLAEGLGDEALKLEAHHAMWNTLWLRGELTAARRHTESGAALYDPHLHGSLAALYGGHDPGVCGLSQAAVLEWLLGYPDRALESSRNALTLAYELAHGESLAWALSMAAIVDQLRGDRAGTGAHAEALIALSAEHGFAQWVAVGTILRAWAGSEAANSEIEVANMRQGIAAWWAAGARRWNPYFLALTVETCCALRRVDEARQVVAEALDSVDRTGERWYEAELHRLSGELSVMGGEPAQSGAEEHFRRAIEVSRQIEAKSHELRATVSLARLLDQQGKRDEARAMLADIYNWFTEGFDTADLKDAKALLDELRA